MVNTYVFYETNLWSNVPGADFVLAGSAMVYGLWFI